MSQKKVGILINGSRRWGKRILMLRAKDTCITARYGIIAEVKYIKWPTMHIIISIKRRQQQVRQKTKKR